MPPRALDSPLLVAFLRALTFAGLTEAIFYRLLPDPSPTFPPGLLDRIHASLSRAGSLTFFLAFFFVVLALVQISYRALRWRIWPPGLNGFLSTCMLCLAVMGFSTVATERGPAFAVAFTLLALLILLLVAMHTFTVAASTSLRAFAVCYSAAVLSSAAGMVGRFLGSMSQAAGSGRELLLLGSFADGALSAGRLLLGAAGVAAFIAFSDAWEDQDHRKERLRMAILLGALAGTAYAAGCLLAPLSLAPQGAQTSPITVVILSWSLFLGVATASANLLRPGRRPLAYGLLVLVLAGFPLRIAYQHMLVVLGAVLVFAPEPVIAEQEAAPPAMDPPVG